MSHSPEFQAYLSEVQKYMASVTGQSYGKKHESLIYSGFFTKKTVQECANWLIRAFRIAALNDTLRQTFSGGLVVKSAGVEALDGEVLQMVLHKVSSYDEFTGLNNEDGEHRFGMFDCKDDKFAWQIDYLNPDFDGESEDPTDPEQTCRVLTIMLASER